jgi:hypothetical protein
MWEPDPNRNYTFTELIERNMNQKNTPFFNEDYPQNFNPAARRPRDAASTLANKENRMSSNSLSTMMGGDKIMNRLFRKADGVVWDMMSGKVGVSTKDGIATFSGEGDDAEIEINMFDQFGMEIPAFAQSTPVSSVSVGDLIYFGSTEKPGWVIEVKYGVKPTGSTTKSRVKAVAVTEEDKSNVQFVLMKTDGQRTTWKAPKVKMLGMGADGVMVIRSLLTMLPGGQAALGGMQNNLMMMMQMSAMSGDEGGIDMEAMIPMMLMGQMAGGDNGGSNNFMQAMMMAQMFKGGGMFGGKKGNTPFSRG